MFQFRLSYLFVAVAVIAFGLAFIWPAWNQHRIASSFVARGGRIAYDCYQDRSVLQAPSGIGPVSFSDEHDNRTGMEAWLPRDLVSGVHGLAFEGPNFGDADLLSATSFPRTRILFISARGGSPVITDEGIVHLAAISSLEVLQLETDHATGAGLAALAHLPLRSLILSGKKIDDSALQAITRLQSLEYCTVQSDLVTDEGIRSLASLPRLKQLQVFSQSCSANVLAPLLKHSTLESVWLDCSKIDDSTLDTLARMNRVTKCMVASPNISEAGLIRLLESGHFKSMMCRCGIGQPAVDRIQARFPDIDLTYFDGVSLTGSSMLPAPTPSFVQPSGIE